MFQLMSHDATLTNINQRIQRHGEERHLAVDLTFQISASNQLLDILEAGLRESLYRPADKSNEQPALPGVGEDLNAVKHPCLQPLKLKSEFSGCELEINGSLEATRPTFLPDVKLKKFVVDPKEGGSVDVTFTAQCEVDSDEVKELSDWLILENVRITITPPAKQEETLSA